MTLKDIISNVNWMIFRLALSFLFLGNQSSPVRGLTAPASLGERRALPPPTLHLASLPRALQDRLQQLTGRRSPSWPMTPDFLHRQGLHLCSTCWSQHSQADVLWCKSFQFELEAVADLYFVSFFNDLHTQCCDPLLCNTTNTVWCPLWPSMTVNQGFYKFGE